ncbi:unnamed protein product [Phytophthora lilii]|uniref:Unnamed protein product n=1 Tax=Phytophthora lilii TaxID=2077276 RepID=A0A9W6TQX5_9STRA|nr:unnamed protein product [Phytophthora lilii]
MADVERVRAMVDRFADLSSFFQAGSKQVAKRNVENATATRLRLQLFDTLSSRLLENWSANAACVLEFAPSLLDLYSGTGSASDDPEEAGSQIIKLGKTLFVLSKDSDNDSNFCNVRYVEAILHAIAEISDEASGNHDDKHSRDDERTIAISAKQQSIPMKTLIYAAGSLKNISNAEDKMARLLATNRAIAILSETMLWRSDDTATSKEIAQFMIQTTGILRNLSVSKSNHKQFLEAHIPQRLCCVIPAFIAHQELMVNISRILSKLTLHELPRAQINQSASNIQNLLDLINHRQNSWLSLVGQQRADVRFQDLLFIRVFFILGNLCAGNDQNRRLIASNGITIMLEILQFYGLRYSDSQRISDVAAINEQEECRRSVEGEQSSEVLIKLIRVIANLAINADVGARLNSCKGLTPLLGILEASQRMEDEELMLNAVSCVTNVSYYSNAPSKTAKGGAPSTDYCFIESNRVAITQLLSRILLDRNEEAVVEAARAFGNLSRFKDVLTYMEEVKVLDCLVVLLDHSNREVVYTVCGVLMNAALDDNMRRALLAVRPTVNDDTIDVRMLLVGIVECAGADDLEMTLIASKALYNLLLCKNIACVTGAVNFTPDAINLHRCIEKVLGAIASHPSGNSKEAGELRHGAGEEELDSMSSRQELCLVLPQLLRSVDSFLDAV